MPIQDIITKHTQTMDHAIEHLHVAFAKLRTGRANPNILEQIKVDYYGQPTPLNQVGSIKLPDAHMLTIEPWDKGMLKAVEKALIDSDLGVTPQNDGKLIRLAFPQPTEERRKELAKEAKKMAEDAKVSVRNTRKDANKKVAALVKEEDLSEDEQKRAENQIQKLTDDYVARIDQVLTKKQEEIMTI